MPFSTVKLKRIVKAGVIAGLLGVATTSAAASNAPVRVNVAFGAPLSIFCERVLDEALGRLGRTLALRTDLPAERAILRVSRGDDDADCLRVEEVRAMYPNLIQVPTPVFDVQFVAFTRAGMALPSGWEALQPYRVGAVKGWKLIETHVKRVQPRSFVQVGSVESLFQMLALGRVDVAALNRMDGEVTLRKLQMKGVVAASTPLASVPLYVTLHRSNGQLARQLDQVFLAMRRDGTWQRLHAQVFAVGGSD